MLKSSKRIVAALVMSLFAFVNLTAAFAAEANQRPQLDDLLLKGPVPGAKFDPTSWSRGEQNSSRKFMVAGLVHSYPLIGMDKSAVHELLGEPQTDRASTYKAIANSEVYNLNSPKCGNAAGYYFDLVYADGRVKQYCVREVGGGEVPTPVYTGQWITKNLKW
jgi:hypothetical protein